MANPLFSSYSQGENRVTSTILAVFEHVSNTVLEEILEGCLEESDVSVIEFQNQVKGEKSIPDGAIRSNTSYWIETKTGSSVSKNQLENHVESIKEEVNSLENQNLLVITKRQEESKVKEVDEKSEINISWFNFDTLRDVLEDVLDRDITNVEDPLTVPTERESYLIRELIRFLYDKDLISGKKDRVLVVAAGDTWPKQKEYGAYFCQAERSFRPSNHMAFYVSQQIKKQVPKVEDVIESVKLTEEGIKEAKETGKHNLSPSSWEKLEEIIRKLKEDEKLDRYGRREKVILLDFETGIKLDHQVKHQDGAFVRGHRYVSLDNLKENPEYTEELG